MITKGHSRRGSPNGRQGLIRLAQLLRLDEWPSEGRTLGEILKSIWDPAEWAELTEHTGELQPRSLNDVPRMAIIPVYPSSSPQYGKLAEETRVFLEAWNSGQLVAKGRRGDLLTAPVEIPPPSVGYDIEVVDFTRSVIRDPTYPKKVIYDLRFFLPNTESKFESAIERNATSRWAIAEALRMKAVGEIDESIKITAFAKELANRMEAARDNGDKSVKPVRWRHIKNSLRDWGLWPITSIK
jgi:hypothetical protein